jgi:hypothetical protein
VPGGADRVDIARDLLSRFGGLPPSFGARLFDWTGTHVAGFTVITVIIIAIVAYRPIRRRLRS